MMKILIAEDDMTSRVMLAAMLKKWGYEAEIAENGKQAWDILQKPNSPKLILLDWYMPEMDGLEVTKNVRKLNASEPPYIILLTSKGEKSDIVYGLANGANDYVLKPYHQDELRARLDVGQRMVDLQHALVLAAMHDPLTGVLNRGAVIELLQKDISREKRSLQHLAVGMVDIDHFKQVNDTYGHLAGDDLLCSFTSLLQSSLRVSDHLGRYGGDEFLIVVPGIVRDDVEDFFNRICSDITQASFNTRAGRLSITISMGVTCLSPDCDVDGLLSIADVALYQAKAEGRNKVVYLDCTEIKNSKHN